VAGETDVVARAGEGIRGLYRYGSVADLVYRDPAAVGPVTLDQEATAALDDLKQYWHIRPASGRIPALISGTLTSPLPPADSTILVAVNGKVAGESKLFPTVRASRRPGSP
jgi:hypothetical protein